MRIYKVTDLRTGESVKHEPWLLVPTKKPLMIDRLTNLWFKLVSRCCVAMAILGVGLVIMILLD